MTRKAVCLDEHYDEDVGTCLHITYLPDVGPIPPLSIAQAQALALPIALLWVSAWVWKSLRRAL